MNKALPLLLLSASVALAQDDVPFLTTTSRSGRVTVEWQNPATGPYGFTRILARTDRYPQSFDDIDLAVLPAVDKTGTPGLHDSIEHTDLDNGRTYFYAAFVNDGVGNWSAGKRVAGFPAEATWGVLWRFFAGTGTTSMAPPGVGSVVLAVSNDEHVYALAPGPDGGNWAGGAVPFTLQGPAQHRPPIIPANGVTSADNFALVGSQDGYVRALDADGLTELWRSPFFGMVQASPAGWFSTWSGRSLDRVYVGTRVAGARNRIYALEATMGQPVWEFDDPAGAGIGIVSAGATVDYSRERLYLASHAFVEGAPTLWALDLVTGDEIWSTPLGNISGSPIQRGNVLYVGLDDGDVWGVDTDTGDPKLNFPFRTGDGMTKAYPFPDLAGDRVYLSTTTTLWCIRDVEPVVVRRWSFASAASPSTPLYPPGSPYLWLGSSDGRLYQVEVATGTPSQEPDFRSVLLGDGGGGVGSPSYDVRFDLLYAGTEDGAIYAVTAPLP